MESILELLGRSPRIVRRCVRILAHFALIVAGFFLAFAARVDVAWSSQVLDNLALALVILLPVRLFALWVTRAFLCSWRYFDSNDAIRIVWANLLGSVLLIPVAVLLRARGGIPYSVLALELVFSSVLIVAARFIVRIANERSHQAHVDVQVPASKRAVIIGAGYAGSHLLRELRHERGRQIVPVALVDDDLSKHGLLIQGTPVFGPIADIVEIVRRFDADLIIIALPTASAAQLRRIMVSCRATQLELKIVPTISEIMLSKVKVTQLRDVKFEDLLGRDPIELDLDGLANEINNRTVLVTGGAGSIGSELCRQISRYGPKRLLVMDRAESALYRIELELRRNHPSIDIIPVVGDIQDRERVRELFEKFRPHRVFHAAAYKHVPMMESHPLDAFRNNVIGTRIVAEASSDFGVETFVLISTDKAVRPANVMGATKRLAEMVILALSATSRTKFTAVRFGNVLGSDGSVIPLFLEQMKRGDALTITHSEVTRYFMTIPEAVQLVLQASILPVSQNRIVMLDMGDPVKIVDLAHRLIEFHGLKPTVDVRIDITGLRPGEKLHEELMEDWEESERTAIEKIRLVRTPAQDSNTVLGLVAELETAVAADRNGRMLVTRVCEATEVDGSRRPDLELTSKRTATGTRLFVD